MNKPIQFDLVSDIYDNYVNTDLDIPFFLKETEGFSDEILELMCGTGRVSIPLAKAGRKLVCVDYSKGMLDKFKSKLDKTNLSIQLVNMDVTELDLKRKFKLVFLPFHSLTEILSAEMQKKALRSISNHLEKNGVFICTLQNPKVRLKSADGTTRMLGNFPIDGNGRLVVSYMNSFDQRSGLVSGYQFYEFYNSSNVMYEKRFLEINFRPISDTEFKEMIKDLGLEIMDSYGDYSHGSFNEETSNFLIYKLRGV